MTIHLDTKVAPHFYAREFACHCGGTLPGCKLIELNQPLINKLEVLRSVYYKTGLSIIDSYRCPEHNKAVGGVPHSQHQEGLAADIRGVVNYKKMAALGLFTGIGFNTEDDKVVHVDVRPGDPHHPTFWTYTNGRTDSPNKYHN